MSSFVDIELALSSHPGLAIVPKWTETRNAWGQWDYIDLGVGPAHKCVRASYDGQFIATTHVLSSSEEMVFDVSMWRYEEGNHLVLVKAHTSDEETRKCGGGRDFLVNPDGTISIKPAPHLLLGNCDGTLGLVNKGSPHACVLANVEKTEEYKVAKDWEAGLRTFTDIDLTLSSHPGLAIVPKWAETRNAWGHWDYIDLGVGPAHKCVRASYDGQFIATTHAPSSKEEMVFDVSMWRCVEGNHLVLVKAHTSEQETRKFGGGRDFIVNPDGTISVKPAPHLLLGNCYGTLALVHKGSPHACVLANVEKTEEYKVVENWEALLRTFTDIDLTLSSHPGLAIVPKWTETRNAWGQWDYIDLGVGPAQKCVRASYDGQFIATSHVLSSNEEMVFDVSMWRYEEGNHLVLVKAHTSDEETRKFGGGRDFLVNLDGTISLTPASHLLLGNCDGTLGLVNKGSPHACVLANVEKTEEYKITQARDMNSAVSVEGVWTEHKNIDMAFQGDVEIIHDTNLVRDIPALKKRCEEKNYSAICVGSFPHAALKKFDYQLESHHCKEAHGYTCTLYIYHPHAGTSANQKCQQELSEGSTLVVGVPVADGVPAADGFPVADGEVKVTQQKEDEKKSSPAMAPGTTTTNKRLIIHEARYGWANDIWAPPTCSHAHGCKDVTDIVRRDVELQASADANENELHLNPDARPQFFNQHFWPETAHGPPIPRKVAIRYSYGEDGPIQELVTPAVPHETVCVHITCHGSQPASRAGPPASGRGFWTEHKNLTMCAQSDVEIIQDPDLVKNIPALKKRCEEKQYSAFVVGSLSHPHVASLKKLDYQLEAHHCMEAHGYSCTLYIYHPPSGAAAPPTHHQVEDMNHQNNTAVSGGGNEMSDCPVNLEEVGVACNEDTLEAGAWTFV